MKIVTTKNVPKDTKVRCYGFDIPYEQWRDIQREASEECKSKRSTFSKNMQGGGLIIISLLAALIKALVLPNVSGVFFWVPFYVTILSYLILIFVLAAKRQRPYLWKAIANHGFPICTHCGYDLRGSSDSSQCPECGTKRKPLPEPAPEEHDALT